MKFRFIISEVLKEEMKNFSKTHIYSTRKKIREDWSDWISENRELIIEEKQKLEEKGYCGTLDNFIDKLFFSVKYYYIKNDKKCDSGGDDKKLTKSASSNEPQKEKVRFSKTMIKFIDNHIHTVLLSNIECPSNCYLDFINNNKEHIYTEILRIKSTSDGVSVADIFEKIKKCYKNRYYNSRA